MDEQKTKEELITELVALRQQVLDLEQTAIANHKQDQITPENDWLELNLREVTAVDPPPNHIGLNRKSGPEQEIVEQTIPPTAETDATEDARTEYRHAEMLQRATAAITETLNLEERLDRILEQLQQVVTCQSASVQLLHDGYLEIVGGRGWSNPEAIIGLRSDAFGRGFRQTGGDCH